MKITAAKPLNVIQRYLLLTVGILITAVGVYFFKFPNNFSTGGVSGLSLILGRLLPSPLLTPSTLVLIINTLLLIVGFIFLGQNFAFSTVYCSMVLSLSLTTMEKLWPMSGPMTNQPFLELCFAVLLPSFGSAILFHLDASSGGTDIIAMIVRKYTSLNIGTALMIADALITLAALFCFGVEAGLFSILGLLLKSVLVDFVTDSFRTKKCFQIITSTPQPIVEFITVTLHRGATLEDVYGAYHHEKKTMIITVLTRAQALALRRFIHVNDPHAFMVITASTEIVGKGFLAS
ncbi:MAG TPA: YitT family protein [Candidatus Ventricola gallistercoris]|nr:YitT family protein [Candidatus Ventricola gallistercoris]